MKKNIFEEMTLRLTELPLWIKECVYFEMLEDLCKVTSGAIPASKDQLYPFYKPSITYLGKQEAASKSKQHSPNIYKFLEAMVEGANIIEVTLNNHWTLEETAALDIECIESQYVAAPSDPAILAMALYCAGNIRIGEYLKRTSVIDIDQLDTAIRKQKEMETSGQWVKMAEVLIELGYVTKKDTDAVLYVKDESKKRYVIPQGLFNLSPSNIVKMSAQDYTVTIPSASSPSAEAPAVQPINPAQPVSDHGIDPATYAQVVRENKILKDKIKGIIAVIQGK